MPSDKQARNQGSPPAKFFFPPWKNVLGIDENYWA